MILLKKIEKFGTSGFSIGSLETVSESILENIVQHLTLKKR
jgi:hypothetical protein